MLEFKFPFLFFSRSKQITSASHCLFLACDLPLITVPILAEMIRGIELGSKVAVIGCSGVGRAAVNGAAIAGLTKLIISIYWYLKKS